MNFNDGLLTSDGKIHEYVYDAAGGKNSEDGPKPANHPEPASATHLHIPIGMLACILLVSVCLGYTFFCCFIWGFNGNLLSYVRRNRSSRRSSQSHHLEQERAIHSRQSPIPQQTVRTITPPPRYSQTVTPSPPSYASAMKNYPDHLQAIAQCPWVLSINDISQASVFTNSVNASLTAFSSPAINLNISYDVNKVPPSNNHLGRGGDSRGKCELKFNSCPASIHERTKEAENTYIKNAPIAINLEDSDYARTPNPSTAEVSEVSKVSQVLPEEKTPEKRFQPLEEVLSGETSANQVFAVPSPKSAKEGDITPERNITGKNKSDPKEDFYA